MAGEPTRNTCVPNSKFIPNMMFSPPLTTQFDCPKDQLYSPVNRPRNTIDHAAVHDILSIQLSTPRTTASKLADQPIIADTQTNQRFNYQSSTNSRLQTTLESTPYTNRYPIEPPISFAEDNPANDILMNLDGKKKYKPVARKIKSVIAELPDKFRIVPNIIGDPLETLPTLPTQPPPFSPTGRYTQERKDLFDKLNPGFLLPAERDLMHYFMMVHEDGFAWETSERGHFREDFFPPVNIPVIQHKPWVQRNIPIPPGLYTEVC